MLGTHEKAEVYIRISD